MSRTAGLIFAAGLGTRLKPFTLDNPKALVPVGGIPMLQRVIRRMMNAGIHDIVVNIHHHADKIRGFLAANDNFGANIILSDETHRLLDTGGGILKARAALENASAVLVHNADILTDIDIGSLIDIHTKNGADITLLVAKRHTSRYLYFDSTDRRLCGWINIKTGETRPEGYVPGNDEPFAYGGIHVFSPSIFNALGDYSKTAGQVFSVTPFWIAEASRLDIRGYVASGEYTWLDVGRPDTLEIANIISPYLDNE